MNEQVLAVIPARGGSKGIPRKNVRELGGKPLVAHAISTGQAADRIDEVVLTTDSQEIGQIGRQYGADAVLSRPASLAADDVPLAPVMQHTIDEVDGRFDYVVCFQPTVPLITPDSIDAGIETALEEPRDSVIFVRDTTHHYWKEVNGTYEPVSPDRENRQWMTPIYGEIGVFVTRCDVVADGARIGTDPGFYEVSSLEGIDIDTYADWVLAESQFGWKQLVYRVAGNKNAGTGHAYRGITIADHLFEHDVLFVVTEAENLAIDCLEESNYDYRVFEDDTALVNFLQADPPDVIVNDILDSDTNCMQALADTGARIVNFEDLGNGREYADAVINALYEYSNPPANHYFGYQYFCLRNEFRYATPHNSIGSVDRIMISFGGTDENNLTAKTLRALSTLDNAVHFDVVLGLGYTQQETLNNILETYPSHITVDVKQDIDSMAAHMEAADLLITSNGRTLYEAGSLNLPAISVAQNQREQKHAYAHVSQGILMLGQAPYVSEENIQFAVIDYMDDSEKREGMRAALTEHDIANGIDRIKAILLGNINED